MTLTGLDPDTGLVTLKEPVPPLVLVLPPGDAILTNPNLFIRGTGPVGASVKINQEAPMEADSHGFFGGTVPLPGGPSTLEVLISLPNGKQTLIKAPVTVQGDYFFLVALGDATWNHIDADGPVPERFQDGFFVDGRFAFYLKGRIQGKYLILAGLDTGDGRLSDIDTRINDRHNRDFFRELDPDAFYPVYGDASQTYRDANTQGRFFVLVETPTSRYEWGNYDSGITGNEFSSYNRTLYGGKAAWKSLRTREDGEPLGQALVFGALPETGSAHDEFLGTGGSLYFLRNREVLPGSEKIRLEARDEITGIPVANIALRQYIDTRSITARDGSCSGNRFFRSPRLPQ